MGSFNLPVVLVAAVVYFPLLFFDTPLGGGGRGEGWDGQQGGCCP